MAGSGFRVGTRPQGLLGQRVSHRGFSKEHGVFLASRLVCNGHGYIPLRMPVVVVSATDSV